MFTLTPAILHDTIENCSLPRTVIKIAQSLAVQKSLKLEQTPAAVYNYIGCHGFKDQLLSSDWAPLMHQYPALYTIVVYCVLLPLIGIICGIYWIIYNKPEKRDKYVDRRMSICLTLMMILLLIPLCFCLWLSFSSYYSLPAESQQVIAMQKLSLHPTYANFLKTIDQILVGNVDKMKEYMYALPNDIKNLLHKFQPPAVSASATEHLYQNSHMTQILLVEMLEEIDDIMMYFTQLIDYVRFFYRNTTTLEYLYMKDEDEIERNKMMLREIEHNGDKMTMLLQISQVTGDLADIIKYAAIMHRRHNSIYLSIDYLHKVHQKYITELWQNNVQQLHNYHDEMKAALKNISTTTTPQLGFYLPQNVASAELAYCIIVLLLIISILVFLFFVNKVGNRKRTSKWTFCLLIGIIVFICIAMIYVGILSIIHFCLGAVMHHFKIATMSAKFPCLSHDTTNFYCNTSSALQAYVQHSLAASNTAKRYNNARALSQNVSNKYSKLTENEVFEAKRLKQLLQGASSTGRFFSTGGIQRAHLETELYMHNLYETQEHFEQLDHAPQQSLLICNLNSLTRIVFQQLLAVDIFKTVVKLSRNSHQLKVHLPKNLSRVLRNVLHEIQTWQRFYNVTFEQLLWQGIKAYPLQARKAEQRTFRAMLEAMPRCDQVRLARLGIPPQIYECQQAALLGFWIGGVGILTISLPMAIICLMLVPILRRVYSRRFATVSFVDIKSGAQGRQSGRRTNDNKSRRQHRKRKNASSRVSLHQTHSKHSLSPRHQSAVELRRIWRAINKTTPQTRVVQTRSLSSLPPTSTSNNAT